MAQYHAEAIIENGGSVILADVNEISLQKMVGFLRSKYKNEHCCRGVTMDVTDPSCIKKSLLDTPKIDILINNAALDPKVTKNRSNNELQCRFENMSLEYWRKGLDVIVNGTFLVSQVVVNKMIQTKEENNDQQRLALLKHMN